MVLQEPEASPPVVPNQEKAAPATQALVQARSVARQPASRGELRPKQAKQSGTRKCRGSRPESYQLPGRPNVAIVLNFTPLRCRKSVESTAEIPVFHWGYELTPPASIR